MEVPLAIDTDHKRKELEMLPDSPKKLQALAMLEDSKRADQRLHESLDQLVEELELLRPTPREQVLYKLLPWLSAIAGLFALYVGLDAMYSGEYCWRNRGGSTGCEKGLRAQLQGAGVAWVGLALVALPIAWLFCFQKPNRTVSDQGFALVMLCWFLVVPAQKLPMCLTVPRPNRQSRAWFICLSA